MIKKNETKELVRSRNIANINLNKPKVEFFAENKEIARCQKNKKNNVLDVNNIARFREK